jgi:chromosome segregation ATPase
LFERNRPSAIPSVLKDLGSLKRELREKHEQLSAAEERYKMQEVEIKSLNSTLRTTQKEKAKAIDAVAKLKETEDELRCRLQDEERRVYEQSKEAADMESNYTEKLQELDDSLWWEIQHTNDQGFEWLIQLGKKNEQCSAWTQRYKTIYKYQGRRFEARIRPARTQARRSCKAFIVHLAATRRTLDATSAMASE